MEYSSMEQYWVWLSSVPGMTPKRFYQLLSIYEDARNVWDNVGDEGMEFLGEKVLFNLDKCRNEKYFYRLFYSLEKSGTRAVSRLNDEYPKLLANIYDPPPTIFVRGKLPEEDSPTIAIVGSRMATQEGRMIARKFSKVLAENGVTVVSGLARGIDTCAHQGSLDGKGRTIAVLGSGPDVIYPTENAALAESILENDGAILSEYVPGMRPRPHYFPIRNRIISGMSRGVLLVEAGKKSGAMITVNYAIEQNRDVFGIPGSICSSMSESANRLIADGAIVALSPWDILESYGWATRPSHGRSVKKDNAPELDPDDERIVKLLKMQALTLSEISDMTDIPASNLISHLTMLVLRGIIVKAPGEVYRAC